MLPFLKRKQEASMSNPVEHNEDDFDALESAMRELNGALLTHNYKLAAEVFRSCFDLLDAAPHVEGPHLHG